MSNEQPESQATESANNVERLEVEKLETAIPYELAMEKNEIINLFRRNHPELPETQRLTELWIEEARKLGEGVEDSSIRESIVKSAQENLLTVKDLARWDTELEPDAIAKYLEWMNMLTEWVREGNHALSNRRQALYEIATADVYLSAAGVNPEYFDEAYDCLLRAAEATRESDLAVLANEKLDAITKVMKFLNKNAKKPN